MDVYEEQFNATLLQILEDIKSSSFIAVDTEFTGLLTDESFKRSYFDSGNSLYEKESQNLENVSVCQVGVSLFKSLKDRNAYDVSTYNFYIRPHSILNVDENILWQVSSLEFLKKCNFNFNKWLEESIPCLNYDQEKEVRSFYAKLLSGESGVLVPYEVLDKMELVRNWMKEAKLGESLDIHFQNVSHVLHFFSSLLHSAICVFATYQGANKVLVTVEVGDNKKRKQSEAEKTLNVILDELKGFVKVFEAIAQAKVPVVLHNGMLDLMLMYKQFHRYLPKSYEEFKKAVHQMFPIVYDTKQLAFLLSIKMRNRDQENVPGGSLDEKFLYQTTLSKVQRDLHKHAAVLHRPAHQHSAHTPKYSDGVCYWHEAGYDAFCTGYCFMHISHIYVHMNEKVEYHRPLSPRELVNSMKQFANEIPIQKAGVKYIVLDGQDPSVKQFSWLVVESRNSFRALSPESVAASLAPFGDVNITKRNKRSVLVAAPRETITRDILVTLRNDKDFTVTKYRPIRHSLVIRSFAWSCAVISTGLSSWFLVNAWKRIRA